MKKVENTMGLLMGLSLSFILSLVGMLSSGSFTVPGFLLSFLVSLLISTIITRIIPLRKISLACTGKLKLQPDSLSYRLVDALVSDLLMSPLMTLIMVYMAYRQATAHGARIPFGPMLLRSEIISFFAAYIVIFLLSPLLLKIALKKAGINPQQAHN